MDDIDVEEIQPALTWKLRQKILYPQQKQYEMDFDRPIWMTPISALF